MIRFQEQVNYFFNQRSVLGALTGGLLPPVMRAITQDKLT